MFAQVQPRLAAYSHVVLLPTEPMIGAPSATGLVPSTRATYDGPLELGEDLMTIQVSSEVLVERFAFAGQSP